LQESKHGISYFKLKNLECKNGLKEGLNL
jgi:hypothetical protein